MSNALLVSDSIVDRSDLLPPPFACSWTMGGLDAGWVQVAGELDMATAPQLERTLREPQLQTHLVVLDLRGLEFMGRAGVHAIVNASTRARKAGHRLVLVHGSPNVNRMFALAGNSGKVEIGDLDAEEGRRAD
jgi:anti-anti-sigma factor